LAARRRMSARYCLRSCSMLMTPRIYRKRSVLPSARWKYRLDVVVRQLNHAGMKWHHVFASGLFALALMDESANKAWVVGEAAG
jgi:hypothetical protein